MLNNTHMEATDVKFDDRYAIGEVLGKGAFGCVYAATDRHTGEDVAVKVEEIGCRYPQLILEFRVLQDLAHVPGVPRVHRLCCPRIKGQWVNAIVMQRLGREVPIGSPDIDIVALAQRLLTILEGIHAQGFIHRDVKPENILFTCDEGPGAAANVHLVDYGLSKCVVYKGKHVRVEKNRELIGTPRYASLRAHLGVSMSRRDDLESLVYCLVYIATGELPWQELGTKHDKVDRYKVIGDMKAKLATNEICEGLPRAAQKTLDYARTLDFEDMPKYSRIQRWWAIA